MLTVAELRRHVQTALDDDAIQRLLDAAAEEIAGYTASDLFAYPPAGDWLPLSHAVDSITEVIEDGTTLAANDYQLAGGGSILVRLNTGTNPRRGWRGPVEVRYSVAANPATREAVQIALVQFDLNYQPGLEQNTAGNWNEMFISDPRAERARILSRLNSGSQVWPV